MRALIFVALAAAFFPLSASAAPATGKTFGVVVVKQGTATAAQIGEARAGLRGGLSAAGAKLIDDVTTLELMRIVDAATGACDDACEKKMRAELPGSTLVFARLASNGTHFALRARGDGPEFSAAGPATTLAAAARQLGNRIGSSSEGKIIVDGGPRGAEFFVNGTKVTPGKNGAVPLAPGRHVIRLGDGTGKRAMARVEVPPGEIVTVTFPGEGSAEAPRIATATKAGPIVVPTPTDRLTKPPVPMAVTAAGGMAVVSRTHSLSGSAGGGFDASFTGVGPAISAEIAMGAPVAIVDVAFVSFVSKAKFDLENGSPSTVGGGSRLRARAAGGWRFTHGTDSPSLTPLLGLSYESHTAEDPKGPDGPLGILVDYTRLALDVEVRGALPLGGVARLDAGLGLSPFSSWQESPKTLGSNPKPGLAPFWRLGADLTMARPWILRAEYAGELRSVTHSGTGTAPVTPDLEDAKVEESLHSLVFVVRRSF